MEKEKSAGCVLYRKDNEIKYLILHYESGHWDFPKGHIEENETEQDTINREVEEETGIKDLTILPNFKEKISYFFKQNGELISKEVIFYLAKTDQEAVKLSHEHIGYIWLPYDKAIEKLTFKNAKEILSKANKFLTQNKGLDEF
tara:strand:- start:56 stop:487 length:432 start_codon:yes stop_codon:yes gene_type:complete